MEKIYKWEFVDVAEMLPEFWGTVQNLRGAASQGNPWPMAKKVTDIMSWVLCFAVYTNVLASKNSKAVPEMLAYLVFIMHILAKTSVSWFGLIVIWLSATKLSPQGATSNPQSTRLCTSYVLRELQDQVSSVTSVS